MPSSVVERSGTLSLPTSASSLNLSGQTGVVNVLFQAMRKTVIDAIDIVFENMVGGSIECDAYLVPDGVDIDTAIAAGYTYFIGRAQFPVTDWGASVNTAVRRTIRLSDYGRQERTMARGARLVLVTSSKLDEYTFSYTGYRGTQFERGFWAMVGHTATQ